MMVGERRRLTLPLLLSLLVHILLLGLTFGGQGVGLPGFSFPWQDRRTEAPELSLVLVPPRTTATETAAAAPAATVPVDPNHSASTERPAAGVTATVPSQPPVPAPPRAVADTRPAESSTTVVTSQAAVPASRPDPTDAAAPLKAGQPDAGLPAPTSEPVATALEQSPESNWVVPPAPPRPATVIASASAASSPKNLPPGQRNADEEAEKLIDPGVREPSVDSLQTDRAQQEAQRRTEPRAAARQEAERLAAERLEADRQG